MLVGIVGSLQGKRYAVPTQGLRIGRQAGNEVHLEDNGVSRQHARLIFHNGALWVQDMGSRNGVFVNDNRVQAHRQLAPGDSIKIGNAVFELQVEDPAADRSVSVVVDRPAEGKRWRIWPLGLAGGILLLLVVAVMLAGRGRVKMADPIEDDDGVSSLLLSTTEGLEPGQDPGAAGAGVEPGAGTPPIPLGDASLSSLIEGDQPGSPGPTYGTHSDIQEEWPEPPPGMSSAELVDQAHGLYNAGRLHDALVAYHQAQQLDPSCEICVRRIDRLNTEITEKISEFFDAGIRYFDDMQFQQAIAAWEMVLLLAPDERSRSHQVAKDYLEKARAQMSHQY